MFHECVITTRLEEWFRLYFIPWFFFMGYSNLQSLSQYCQNRLLENLRVVLDECGCRSLEIWMENILADARFRHMMLDEENFNTLHCVDEEDDIINITFPAIIDLEGEHSCIRPFFSLEGHEQVNFYRIFVFY